MSNMLSDNRDIRLRKPESMNQMHNSVMLMVYNMESITGIFHIYTLYGISSFWIII